MVRQRRVRRVSKGVFRRSGVMKTDENVFLRDLARLLEKHGPRPFEELARLLSDESSRAEVISALVAFAGSARQISSKKPKSSVAKAATRPSGLSVVRELRRD